MLDTLYSDIAVTWLGMAGCLSHVYFMWQKRRGSAFVSAALFLFGLLSLLLGVRGFFWLAGEPAVLGRLVFAAATLLPIAVTLFSEQVLRRHHPFLVKAGALLFSAVFFCINLIVDLASTPPLLIGFLLCLLVILGANGWLLLTGSRADLTQNEVRLARAISLAAACSLPLAITDFRQELGGIPFRLGAIAPLLMIYVLLHLHSATETIVQLVARLTTTLFGAAVLALMFGLVNAGFGGQLVSKWLHGLPIAAAWMLTVAIFMQTRTLALETRSQNFLRWLLHVRLDSLDGLIGSLKKLPLTAEHIVLRSDDLAGYDIEKIFALAKARRTALNLGEARTWLGGGEVSRLDVAEQLVDLFERHEMTHALCVTSEAPIMILLKLPQGASMASGEARVGVIQRLARRIVNGAGHAA